MAGKKKVIEHKEPAPAPVEIHKLTFVELQMLATLIQIVDALHEYTGQMEPWKRIREDIERLSHE